MAHTPQDCARLYAVMAGPDFQVGSEQSRIQPKVTIPKTLLKSLVGLKVGIDQCWNQAGVPDSLFNPFQKRLNWMIDQGFEIIEIKEENFLKIFRSGNCTFYHAGERCCLRSSFDVLLERNRL